MTSQQKTPLYSRSKQNHRLTVGYTYFEESYRLEKQIEIWKQWPSNVDIFLVDDGSYRKPALDVIKDVHLAGSEIAFPIWAGDKTTSTLIVLCRFQPSPL